MKVAEIKKLIRFSLIYGLRRALFKAAGRLRVGSARLFSLNFSSKNRNVAVIGCGQFAFATIGSILEIYSKSRYVRAFDVDRTRQQSLENFYGIDRETEDVAQILGDRDVNIVYIASNHASHTDYAIEAINVGKTVYIEKPVSVTWEQFSRLSHSVKTSQSPVYVGYNRPFSRAIKQLEKYKPEINAPLTLSFFVSGHVIPEGHWYRQPDEGTRVCGNMGHWLDLAIHILSWHAVPDHWGIKITPSDVRAPDDNCAIVLTSSRGDLVTLILTARDEPYEGINESVNLQWGNLIAKIDDFRSMSVWLGDSYKKFHYWPKDVGHKGAILQPFSDTHGRWNEVRLSTVLMLTITDMIRSEMYECEISLADQIAKHTIV